MGRTFFLLGTALPLQIALGLGTALVLPHPALPLVKAPGVERSVRPHALQEPLSGYALF